MPNLIFFTCLYSIPINLSAQCTDRQYNVFFKHVHVHFVTYFENNELVIVDDCYDESKFFVVCCSGQTGLIPR